MLSVRKIRANVKVKNKFENKKNRIPRLSLFEYSKFWNSNLSVVLHLVVPNFDPRPSKQMTDYCFTRVKAVS